MKTRMQKTNQIFKRVRSGDAERYAQDAKEIPDIDIEEHAQRALKILDNLYKQYAKKRDEQGIQHLMTLAEITINQANNKGLIEAEQALSAWLKEKTKKEEKHAAKSSEEIQQRNKKKKC